MHQMIGGVRVVVARNPSHDCQHPQWLTAKQGDRGEENCCSDGGLTQGRVYGFKLGTLWYMEMEVEGSIVVVVNIFF